MTEEALFQYAKKQYGTEPEYLCERDPDAAVLRHKSGKWYAVFMRIEKQKLGLAGDGMIDIMDVKCDSQMASFILQSYGIFPDYHMNKKHWITILLDDFISEVQTLDFLGYEL